MANPSPQIKLLQQLFENVLPDYPFSWVKQEYGINRTQILQLLASGAYEDQQPFFKYPWSDITGMPEDKKALLMGMFNKAGEVDEQSFATIHKSRSDIIYIYYFMFLAKSIKNN
jgi:hypothetical protein